MSSHNGLTISQKNQSLANDSIKIWSLATDDSIVVNKHIDIRKNRYILEYGNSVNLDTNVVCSDYRIRLISKYDTSRSYILPEKYVWDNELKGVKIYYSQSLVTIGKMGERNTDSIQINENTFSALLSKDNDQVKRYGVLSSMHIEPIDTQNNVLKLYYSYSIPFSDLGANAAVVIDVKTAKITPSLE